MLLHFKEAVLADQIHTPGLTEENEALLHQNLSAAFAKVMASTRIAGLSPFDASGPVLTQLADMMAATALGKSIVLRLKPETTEADRQAIRTFAETLMRVTNTVDETRLEAAIGKLAEVLLPDELEGARGVIAADNLDIRDRFVRELPQLTSTDVGQLSGLSAKNSYATANRWKKNGEIFSINHRGRELFPAFQFRDGRPHPTIKQVLAALPDTMTAWQRALWFVSANGWLDDEEPIDHLNAPQKLEAAALREHEDVIG